MIRGPVLGNIYFLYVWNESGGGKTENICVGDGVEGIPMESEGGLGAKPEFWTRKTGGWEKGIRWKA